MDISLRDQLYEVGINRRYGISQGRVFVKLK